MKVKHFLAAVLWVVIVTLPLLASPLSFTIYIVDHAQHGLQATASLGGVLRTTDRDGRIIFTGMEPNRYELKVSPVPPYRSFQTVVTVPSPSNAVVFVLEKP